MPRRAVTLVQEKRPTILLLDLSLPRIYGLDVLQQVTQLTTTKVLILSMHSLEAYVTEALAKGAGGYVLKCSKPGELIVGIRDVAAGRQFLSSDLPNRELLAGTKAEPKNCANYDALSVLTGQEKVILQLAAEENNNDRTAWHLSLSARTVESHRASLMRKLKLRSQTGAGLLFYPKKYHLDIVVSVQRSDLPLAELSPSGRTQIISLKIRRDCL